MTPDVAQASRLHGLGIGYPFLVPTRCVGTRKLRAAESIGPVSTIRIPGNQTCRLSGIIRCSPEGVCSERCRQLVMGAVSRPEDGSPSRPGVADILSALLVTGKNLNIELPTQLVISQS